ncbi:hypothetical protein EPIR_3536 [Erwinia piriflorinigrans CFBP 5888]|uniref:Uncharacterized protein n=1 Tax=Erwinia piriflorinigrans CFBP 5888 TaxID=1161919 RepID=V5ZD35_9GAMM|nr:hypothetical protein EPIR_3536 [Erwinia piriflorinigrans CFBP 5888]
MLGERHHLITHSRRRRVGEGHPGFLPGKRDFFRFFFAHCLPQ